MEANKELSRKREEEYYESGFIQLPLWREEKRGAPNSFLRSALFAAIQSKDRADMKRAKLFSQQGITIIYSGQQLNQEDMTVWLSLVDLAKEHPLGTECNFTAHSILKYMGAGVGGKDHERLSATIDRMTGCLIKVEGERYIFGGSLIDSFVIDKETKQYKVKLNRHLIKLFGENDWTAIDWEERKQLKGKPLALKLHDYYSSHENPKPVTIEFLSSITGSKNSQLKDVRRKVKVALEELVKIGFLKRYDIEENLVKVVRVPKPHRLINNGV